MPFYCPICLEDDIKDDKVIKLDCNHCFCQVCINHPSIVSCPICRTPIPFSQKFIKLSKADSPRNPYLIIFNPTIFVLFLTFLLMVAALTLSIVSLFNADRPKFIAHSSLGGEGEKWLE